METITSIEEVYDRKTGPWDRQDGFLVRTTEQEVWFGISNDRSCCESWGYLLSEDDPQKFVGAELRGVTITDTNRTARTFVDMDSLDEGDAMFIDVETDRGVLQFVAYNAHNGYYGHEATVESRQLQHSVTL